MQTNCSTEQTGEMWDDVEMVMSILIIFIILGWAAHHRQIGWMDGYDTGRRIRVGGWSARRLSSTRLYLMTRQALSDSERPTLIFLNQSLWSLSPHPQIPKLWRAFVQLISMPQELWNGTNIFGVSMTTRYKQTVSNNFLQQRTIYLLRFIFHCRSLFVIYVLTLHPLIRRRRMWPRMYLHPSIRVVWLKADLAHQLREQMVSHECRNLVVLSNVSPLPESGFIGLFTSLIWVFLL